MHKVEKAICQAIEGTQFEGKTYIVGGFVRDEIMNITSDDIDIVVALPDGGCKLADFLFEKGVSSRPVTYDSFGTALVDIKGYKVEFVMTRKESYRDKDRKPEVEGGTLLEDVYRRDFTINSLLMDITTGEILDKTGKGMKDIEKGIIRATSEPALIFKEDPLRMLRAVRFANRFNFEIEAKTKQGIVDNSEMLEHISWERKRDEFVKMMESKTPVVAMKMLLDLNLMKHIIPELLDLDGVEQDIQHDQDVLGHSLRVLGNTGMNLKVRLAALLHDIAKGKVKSVDERGIHFYKHEVLGAEMAKTILNRLKFPNEISNDVTAVVRNHMRLKDSGAEAEIITDKAIRKLIMQTGEALELILHLVHADNISHAPDFCLPKQVPYLRDRISNILQDLGGKTLPVSGKDIMFHFKIKGGKMVGELLSAAEEIWHENPHWEKAEILRELENRD